MAFAGLESDTVASHAASEAPLPDIERGPPRAGRLFAIQQRRSTLGRELIAGCTTFGAMSYIIVVNSQIMAVSGIEMPSLITATIITALVSSLLMALWADMPIALAPGMGVNVVIAQVVLVHLGLSFAIATTMVLVAAAFFFLLSITRFRGSIVRGVPPPIQIGMTCGIGLIIATIGMRNAGIVSLEHGQISFGSLSKAPVLLAFIGMVLTPALVARRVPAALLISICALTLAGLFVAGSGGKPITELPSRVLQIPHWPDATFLKFDLAGFARHLPVVAPITLYFFLSSFFSATATLVAVTTQANLVAPDGSIPKMRQAYAADGMAAIVGAIFGMPTVTTFVESATGVEAGGRTGLTALVVAGLFGAALFFWPLFVAVPPQATAPALVIVGLMMISRIRDVDFSDATASTASLLMLLVTALTSDLMMAIASGLFVYTCLALATGRRALLTPIVLGLDAVFLVYVVLAQNISA
jgi:adenine/guanine/hypoxanthine permease